MILNTENTVEHNITYSADLLRLQVNTVLDPQKKSALGQFFTPEPICKYMASLFDV